MSNFWQRTLTGIVFVTVVIGAILVDYLIFAGVMSVFVAVGLWEFYSLAEKKRVFPLKIPGIIAGLLIFLVTVMMNAGWIESASAGTYFGLLFLIGLLFFVWELYRKSENPFMNIAVEIAGLFYVSIPFSLLVSIPVLADHKNSLGTVMLISFFLLMWIYDIFAYLTGMWLGKHRLFERISPKKSWEGFFGGTIFCAAAAIGLSCFFNELLWWQWTVFAVLIVIFGTLGDLVESMLKRSAGVKDSGMFFPGHGGVLDRFDAVLLSAPFIYFYLSFFL